MAHDGIVGAIFGRRRSGKTTRARQLVGAARRLVVFDPIGEWPGFGLTRCDTLEELRAHLAATWRTGFRVALVCSSNWPLELHRLADWLARAQLAGGRRAPLLQLVVDELSLSFPVTRPPAGQDAMMRVCLQGRHHRIGVLGIAQRPASVSPDFRGQVAELWAFALPSELDRRAVAGMLGGEHLEALRTLEDHRFLHLSPSGVVTRGRNSGLGRPVASALRGAPRVRR